MYSTLICPIRIPIISSDKNVINRQQIIHSGTTIINYLLKSAVRSGNVCFLTLSCMLITRNPALMNMSFTSSCERKVVVLLCLIF